MRVHFNNIETSSEKNYENLEPWIQWVSFYTGKSYEEHKVFFLNELIVLFFIYIFLVEQIRLG